MITTEQHTYKDTMEKLIDEKVKKIKPMDIIDIVAEGVKDNYLNSKNIDGTGMTPNAAATIAYKRRLGVSPPDKPLRMTDQLMNSNVKKSINENEAHLYVADKVRRKTSNIAILKREKGRGRFPFGLTSEIKKNVLKFIKSILKF